MNFRTELERRKGKRDQVEQNLLESKQQIRQLTKSIKQIEKAQAVIQIVAQKTQQELKYHISEIVTLAMDAVPTSPTNKPYVFDMDFVVRRGKTEVDLYFVRNSNRMHPLRSSGVGAADIASFALRVALHNLKRPRTRNVLILDEPFKHLKGEEANRLAIQMVKEISVKLGLQIITVSDERAAIEDIENGADKVFRVSIDKGVSKIN